MRNANWGSRKLLLRAALGLGLIATLVGAASAVAAGPTIPARHTGGYVAARGAGVSPNGNPANNLSYHGGPVMRVNKTYAIYWQPLGYSFSANYKTLIDRYFADVAAASGANTNVYSVETPRGRSRTRRPSGGRPRRPIPSLPTASPRAEARPSA